MDITLLRLEILDRSKFMHVERQWKYLSTVAFTIVVGAQREGAVPVSRAARIRASDDSPLSDAAAVTGPSMSPRRTRDLPRWPRVQPALVETQCILAGAERFRLLIPARTGNEL